MKAWDREAYRQDADNARVFGYSEYEVEDIMRKWNIKPAWKWIKGARLVFIPVGAEVMGD